MKYSNLSLFAAGVTSVTLNANWTSKPFRLELRDGGSIQLNWTGTPSGTFKVQCSNDAGQTTDSGNPDSVTGLNNWTDITGATAAAGGAAGSAVFDITTQVRWVRVVYTFSASTGTLTNAQAHSKGSF